MANESDQALRDRIHEWLAEGPRRAEELVERATAAGLVDADDPEWAEEQIERILERTDDTWEVGDGRIVLTSTFVDSGMTFTHRLAADELADGSVLLAPDLSVVDWNVWDGIPLVAGGLLESDHSMLPEPSRLRGPEGWLAGFAAGDLLAFTRRDGMVEVSAVTDPGDGAAEIEALRTAAARWISGGHGEEEVAVLMEAMALDPSLFRSPVPPVGELMEAAGLERRGVEWGWVGEAWQTRQESFSRGDVSLRRRYGFDTCCDAAFDRLVAAWDAHDRGEPWDAREAVEDLGHSMVSMAFLEPREEQLDEVADFAEQLAAVGGRRSAAAHTLLGLVERRRGDALAAEEAFGRALRLDPDEAVAASEQALLVLDRGDLARAHSLAQRADLDPSLVELIGEERARRDARQPKVGRNEPCPCGSGRKFKQCCAGGGTLSLADRLPWLLQRMAFFAGGPEYESRLFGLACSAADTDAPDLVASIQQFVGDPFLLDVAVHEGGLGHEYLEERAPLLPDDERDLVGRILAEERRLWEITAVEEGVGLELRDTGSGDVVSVSESRGSKGRTVGELVLARAVEVDGRSVLCGVPVAVPLRHRDRVLDMLDGYVDADGFAMWYGSMFKAPTLQNREGEAFVLHRTVLDVHDDLDAVALALDEAYERDGDELVWRELFAISDDEEIVRGTVRLDPDNGMLVVESNSEERQDRLLDAVLDLVDAEVLEELSGDELELDDEDDEDAGRGLTDLVDLPDDVREAVEQHIRRMEEQWVDESIPALAGLTPRQALDDPTRREDLFALLREFRTADELAGGMAMSVDRLEDLLGIEPGDRP